MGDANNWKITIMTYKLLALDLDGTIIGTDLVIPERVQTGIARLLQQGIYVTIATGRMFAATIPFAQQLGLREAVICYQGAMVRHITSNTTLAHFPMPADAAAEAVTFLQERGVFTLAYVEERLCFAQRTAALDMYLAYHPHHVELQEVADFPQFVRENQPTKLLFVDQPEIIGPTLELLAPRFAGRLATIRSHAIFGELTALGVSKGDALAALASQLGIAQHEVVAIGDQENDLSMIRWAGLGLAMGNAIPEVKAAAQAILPSVEEQGVATAIERYFV
jgi:Cof subfamily protein (haloacid dehalogenase superfamily)